MKLALAAIFLVASVMALGGIAAADVTQGVTATGTVSDELDFTVAEATGGIALSAIYPTAGTATGSATLFTTGTWSIAGTDSGKMTDGTHTLAAPLVYSIVAASGVPGDFTPTTSYSQAFTSGDYAGDYSTTVTWTASATF